MASQDSQSSQDLKDENVQEPGSKQPKPKTLGEEWKEQSNTDFKKLYDTKFVPWMKKNMKSYPSGQLDFPESEFGAEFGYTEDFLQSFKWMAHEDKLTVVNRWQDRNTHGYYVYYRIKRHV